MELRIKITRENKEKVFTLISAFLDEEEKMQLTTPRSQFKGDYLTIPSDIENLVNGRVMRYGSKEDLRLQLVGTWGQFNSFFPIKAALRILANSLLENNSNSINFGEFVFKCINIFNKVKIYNKKLGKFRGFPRRKKDTAIGRFVWHFLTPAQEMGLLKITSTSLDYNGIPSSSNDWSKANISISQEGFDFSKLQNPLFDKASLEQVLGDDESIWVIDFLKKIDGEGFREYSLLKDIFKFLKQGHNGKDDLWSWFENDNRFMDYVKSWSRKSENPEEFRNQISNLAKTYAASKIALLRELGVVRNKRGDYTIVKEL